MIKVNVKQFEPSIKYSITAHKKFMKVLVAFRSIFRFLHTLEQKTMFDLNQRGDLKIYMH